MHDEYRTDTALIHAGEQRPRVGGAAVLPIFQSAVFEFHGEDGEELRYPRYGNNPNQAVLNRKIAELEGAEDAVVAASGMAAISTALLAAIGKGGHLLVQECLYGGATHFVEEVLPMFGMEADFIDADAPSTWKAKLKPNTRAIYTEALTNPRADIADHRGIVDFAREHGLRSLIDNTFASPVNFRAVAFGYDCSLHSCTKYLNGHSDLCAGVAAGSREFIGQVRRLMSQLGGTLDPHACFLLHRGIRTLALRVRHQNASATALARFLEKHPKVARVDYPGLESHPRHARARELFSDGETRGGCGGVLAFEMKGGKAAAQRLLEGLEIPIVGPSLGGVETLVSRTVTTSHRGLAPDVLARQGITEGLIRVAVGIESADDLIADFDRALAAC